MADLLNVAASDFAGDPTDVILWRGDLAIEREGGFHGDEGTARAHEVYERFIQLFGGAGGGWIECHVDAGLSQEFEAFP